jgi:hypothetical protein
VGCVCKNVCFEQSWQRGITDMTLLVFQGSGEEWMRAKVSIISTSLENFSRGQNSSDFSE